MRNQQSITRQIRAIDQRIELQTRTGAGVEVTYADVAALGATGETCDVLLYGETESAYASTDFRLPNGLRVQVGDRVRVSIDSRGGCWVDEVIPASYYSPLELWPSAAKVAFGPGTSVADVALRRTNTKYLTLDDGDGGNVTLNVVGTFLVNGAAITPDFGEVGDIAALTFGASGAAGSTGEVADAGHVHPMPADPVTAHVSASDPHTQYQLESEKGSASGYASLDAGTKVPIAQIPTGTTSSTVSLGNHAHSGVYEPSGTVTTHAASLTAHNPTICVLFADGTTQGVSTGIGTLTDIPWSAGSQVIYDPSSMFDDANDGIRIPVAGTYRITAYIEFSAHADGVRRFVVKLNGSIFLATVVTPGANYVTGEPFSIVCSLAQNDLVSLACAQSSGGSLTMTCKALTVERVQ